MPQTDFTPADRAWLAEFEQYLESSFADPRLSVSDMADAMALSERQLHRRVKRLTGRTPLRYLRRLRLQRAHALLEARQVDTVGELAAAVGYRRTDYFSQLYRDLYGGTPHEQLREQLT